MTSTDTELTLHITLGGTKHTVTATPSMTWGDVTFQLAAASGVEVSHIRLLYKGKTAAVDASLLDSEVKSGARLMAMKTRAAHSSATREAQSGGEAAAAKAAVELRDAARGALETEDGKVEKKREVVLGDGVQAEKFFVLVKQGKMAFRVVLEDGGSVGDLKTKLAGFCDTAPSEMRILFSGKRCDDDSAQVVADLGAKTGSMFMLMMSMRHHDAIEAGMNLRRIAVEVENTEKMGSGLDRRVRKRLVDDFGDVVVGIGEVEGEAGRLLENLESVRRLGGGKDGARVDGLEQKVKLVLDMMEALRVHAKVSFG